MITRLIIGNFKAIRGPVEIDLRPITLLFGPNAAGKSSILQAIHYAIETLEGRWLDTYYTRLGREYVNLGGFGNFVHNHDLSSVITLGFEQNWYPTKTSDSGFPVVDEALAMLPAVRELHRNIKSHRVVWRTGSQARDGGPPAVTASEIEINDEPIATLASTLEGRCGLLGANTFVELKLNLAHSLFGSKHPLEHLEAPELTAELASTKELVVAALGESTEDGNGWARISISFVQHGTGNFHRWSGDALPLPQYRVRVTSVAGDTRAKQRLAHLLDTILISPMIVLAGQLEPTIHVGPLRSVLPRDSEFIGAPKQSEGSWHDIGCWYDGSAAWLLPTRFRSAYDYWVLLDPVNMFLHDNDLMDTGLRLEVIRQRRFEDNLDDVVRADERNSDADEWGSVDVPELADFIGLLQKHDAELESSTKERLIELLRKIREDSGNLPSEKRLVLRDTRRNISLTLQDVGAGISQVIPVLMAMFYKTASAVRMIEQPELHLHPKAQVALGDALIRGVIGSHHSSIMLIETHSEHLLLRLLRRVREAARGEQPAGSFNDLTPEDLAVIYVEPSGEGAQVRRLRVDEQGDFIDRWPSGFFDERAGELFS